MDNNFISVCLLGWKRPQMLIECIDSLIDTIDYPCEIILNIDAEDFASDNDDARETALSYFALNKVSKLIMSNGHNRGVGRSLENCIGLAEGKIVLKCDSDLIFQPKWASTVAGILDNNETVGCVGLFDYQNYDPVDERFKILESRPDYHIVTDFVSSAFAFRASDLTIRGGIPDDGLHQKFGQMVITRQDYVKNQGFGRNSVYLTFDEEGNPHKTQTAGEPLILTK